MKYIRVLIQGMGSFKRIVSILQKSLQCLTSLKIMLSLMCLTIYIYAVIAPELFFQPQERIDEIVAGSKATEIAFYKSNIFGDFRTFDSTLFAMFQLMTESNWHFIIIYEQHLNGDYLVMFFGFCVQVSINLVLRSLLLGMIWEVFIIVSKNDNIVEQVLTNDKMEDLNRMMEEFMANEGSDSDVGFD